ADGAFQPAALAHHFLGALGIVPQRRILDARVELVEPAHGAVPVERAPHQRQRRLDPLDVGLPFGTHARSPSESRAPSAGALTAKVGESEKGPHDADPSNSRARRQGRYSACTAASVRVTCSRQSRSEWTITI